MTAKLVGTKGSIAVERRTIQPVKTVNGKSILTGSKTTKVGTNGDASRKCRSWIESFVESTEALEAPVIWRKWAAISTLAATVEQRLYMVSGGERLSPNIYCALIGHPGTGKTRCIKRSRRYYMETEEPHLAPTSMSAASMIDAVAKSKRSVMMPVDGPFEYCSMYITADELSAFMKQYDEEATGTMSTFYDPQAYGQTRRGNDLNIKMKMPHLNLIVGTTPSNLLHYMPETAWEQGFTSRFIFVFSDERTIGDDFAATDTTLSPDLVHDLRSIGGLVGSFTVTEDYRNCVNTWRQLGEPPVVSHPKLIHYGTRRRVHLYKLSMVSAIDRSDVLVLTRDDFNRAMNWMTEAERHMPDIFKAGAGNADGKAMDEIFHYVLTLGAKGLVPERKIINFAKDYIPIHSVQRAIEIMSLSGRIRVVKQDLRTGQRFFKAEVPEVDEDGNLA
jgi:hypothetical protein